MGGTVDCAGFERLASFSRLVMFDRRGDRAVRSRLQAADTRATGRDLVAVLDAAGIERTEIWGRQRPGPLGPVRREQPRAGLRSVALLGRSEGRNRAESRAPRAIPRCDRAPLGRRDADEDLRQPGSRRRRGVPYRPSAVRSDRPGLGDGSVYQHRRLDRARVRARGRSVASAASRARHNHPHRARPPGAGTRSRRSATVSSRRSTGRRERSIAPPRSSIR